MKFLDLVKEVTSIIDNMLSIFEIMMVQLNEKVL